MLNILAATTIAIAIATASPAHAQASAGSSSSISTTDDDGWNRVPIYLQTRGSLAVPGGANGDVAVAGGALGIILDDEQHNSLGLRFSYMDDPPESPFAGDTPALPSAWGPVVDWTYVSRPKSRASFFFSGSVGYVYGTPEDESYDNVILPIIEGGLGLRFSKRLDSGRILYVAPEMGFVPGAVAPLTALNLGMILPGGRQ